MSRDGKYDTYIIDGDYDAHLDSYPLGYPQSRMLRFTMYSAEWFRWSDAPVARTPYPPDRHI